MNRWSVSAKRALCLALSLVMVLSAVPALAFEESLIPVLGTQSGFPGNESKYYLDYTTLAEEQEAAEAAAPAPESGSDDSDTLIPSGDAVAVANTEE